MNETSPAVLIGALLVATALRRVQDDAIIGVRHDVLRSISGYRRSWRRRSTHVGALLAAGIGSAVLARTIAGERRRSGFTTPRY